MFQNKSTTERTEKERPFGVSVIAVVVMAFGALTTILGLLGMLVGFVSGIMDTSRGAGFVFAGGLVGLLLGVVYVLAGVGLWNLRAWAWWLAFLVGIVGFVLAFGSPFWMVTWLVLAAYLFVVRATFGTLPNVPRVVKA